MTTPPQPRTAEGDLIRVRREMLGLTVEQACKGTPIKRGKWGDTERGRTHAAKDRPAREWHAPASVVATMAMRLDLAPGELRKAGRGDAAEIMEREAASPSPARREPPHAFDPDTSAALDRMFEALIRDKRPSEAESLRMRWRDIDGEGRLRPLADRARAVAEWIEDNPARPAAGQRGLEAI